MSGVKRESGVKRSRRVRMWKVPTRRPALEASTVELTTRRRRGRNGGRRRAWRLGEREISSGGDGETPTHVRGSTAGHLVAWHLEYNVTATVTALSDIF